MSSNILVSDFQKIGFNQDENYQINPSTANKGLLFERFFDGYAEKDGNKFNVDSNAKLTFLNKFVGECGDKAYLEQHAKRQSELAKNLGGMCLVFSVENKLVSGLGNQHPIENGFDWHFCGVPYLRGTQIKSALKRFIQNYTKFDLKQEQEKKDFLDLVFNDSKASKKESTAINFLDALPIEPPTLFVANICKHSGHWLDEGNTIESLNEPQKLPIAWHDPTVIPFLAVSKANFLVPIIPSNNTSLSFDNTLFKPMESPISELLALALSSDYIGIGAKTNIGFGGLKYEAEKTEAANESDEHIRFVKELISEGNLEIQMSKDKNKLKQRVEDKRLSLQTICEILLEHHGDLMEEMKNADKKTNFNRAYKFITKEAKAEN